MRTRFNRIAKGAVMRTAGAAAVASVLLGATAGRAAVKEMLPGFSDKERAGLSAIFSNAFYSATITTKGSLRVTLMHEGKKASSTLSLFDVGFSASRRTGGYTVSDSTDYSLRAETKLPVAQPAGPVEFRVDTEKGDRLMVEIVFEEKSIVVDAKFRGTQRSNVSSSSVGVPISGMSGSGKFTEAKLMPPEMLAACQAIKIEIVPEEGEPLSFSFAERPKPIPRARDWSVRGRWDGYVLHGRTLTKKGEAFGYHQYRGTLPAHGFEFRYSLSDSRPEARVRFEFEPVERTGTAGEEKMDMDAIEGSKEKGKKSEKKKDGK